MLKQSVGVSRRCLWCSSKWQVSLPHSQRKDSSASSAEYDSPEIPHILVWNNRKWKFGYHQTFPRGLNLWTLSSFQGYHRCCENCSKEQHFCRLGTWLSSPRLLGHLFCSRWTFKARWLMQTRECLENPIFQRLCEIHQTSDTPLRSQSQWSWPIHPSPWSYQALYLGARKKLHERLEVPLASEVIPIQCFVAFAIHL